MPVAREKGNRRRTLSSSSDGGQVLQAHTFSPPKTRYLPGDWEANDTEGSDPIFKQASGGDSFPSCCTPKGCVQPDLDPSSIDVDSVKVICSNDKCPYSPFMHSECFSAFEEQLLSCLRGMSRARTWSEKQRRQNLWAKKGWELVYKMSTCRCGKGSLRKDLSYTPETGEKLKRKRKRSVNEKSTQPVAPTVNRVPNGVQRSRSRSGRHNSDSVSSENGAATSYMQPFAHRTDYSVFHRTVPRHLVNSYHIKMEDDGYGAGDETRSFVLSSLAFHRTSYMDCVLCATKLTVYDQYPLVDGTFYLSPLRPSESSLEVESKGDDLQFLSAVCLGCLVGTNEVTCIYCSRSWNGNFHQIGTLYSYDIFAALPCCPGSVLCLSCDKPVVDHGKIALSFSQLSSQVKCCHCGALDFHFIKPITRFQVKTK